MELRPVTLLACLSLLRVQTGTLSDSTTLILTVGLVLLLQVVASAAVITAKSIPERTLIVGTSPLVGKLLEEITARRESPTWSWASPTMNAIIQNPSSASDW